MHFWKMEASGNDFVVIMDELDKDYSSLAIQVCHRQYGIGADGLLVMNLKPLAMKIYNADGSLASMCGNGLRCIAYLYSHMFDKLSDEFVINTSSGEKKVSRDKSLYYIEMGQCVKKGMMEVEVNGTSYSALMYDMGVKHAVLSGESYSDSVIASIGQKLDCNINLVEFVSNNQIKVRTYERGVGWTLGCGTGACVCCAFLETYYDLNDYVVVYQNGGEVLVIKDEDKYVLCGGASLVFEGEWPWNE